MKQALEKVDEFHRAFHVPTRSLPGLPGNDRRSLRADLLKEEYCEYLYAEYTDNLLRIADALADMVVIICGTALEYGIPLDRVFEEVHRSNMSKLGADGKPVYREDGKVLKGPGYFRPNIMRALSREVV